MARIPTGLCWSRHLTDPLQPYKGCQSGRGKQMHLSIEGRKQEKGGLHRGDKFKRNATFICLPKSVGLLIASPGYQGWFQAQTPHCVNAAFDTHIIHFLCWEEQHMYSLCIKKKIYRETLISQGLWQLSWTNHRWRRNSEACMLSRKPIGQSYTELMNLYGRTYPLGLSPHYLALKGLWYPACHLMRCTEWYD